jgi:hypothetical protein
MATSLNAINHGSNDEYPIDTAIALHGGWGDERDVSLAPPAGMSLRIQSVNRRAATVIGHPWGLSGGPDRATACSASRTASSHVSRRP